LVVDQILPQIAWRHRPAATAALHSLADSRADGHSDRVSYLPRGRPAGRGARGGPEA
jgi:hypothetical protein